MSAQAPHAPNRGKPLATSEHGLTQTDITGGNLVRLYTIRLYTIPSSIIVLPETKRRTKLTGHPQGPEQRIPKLNLQRWPHSGRTPGENRVVWRTGTPPHHRSKTPPPRTTDMKHSITVRTRNKNTNRQSAGMKNTHMQWTRSIQIKTEVYKPLVRRANSNNMRYENNRPMQGRQHIYSDIYAITGSQRNPVVSRTTIVQQDVPICKSDKIGFNKHRITLVDLNLKSNQIVTKHI